MTACISLLLGGDWWGGRVLLTRVSRPNKFFLSHSLSWCIVSTFEVVEVDVMGACFFAFLWRTDVIQGV